jgi:hypothetical protein
LLLLDVVALGVDAAGLSDRVLERKVAATPVRRWGGEVAARHLRLAFSNEPVERLALLGERMRAASRKPASAPEAWLQSCARCSGRRWR